MSADIKDHLIILSEEERINEGAVPGCLFVTAIIILAATAVWVINNWPL